MPHSYSRIWIHYIWSTKYRERVMFPKFAVKIAAHLVDAFIQKKCFVKKLNVQPEHVHAFILLNPVWSPAKLIKDVKGETSHWINEDKVIPAFFSWQKGYAAFSVSESMVETVAQYIENQDKHHRKTTFDVEYENFLKRYGLK